MKGFHHHFQILKSEAHKILKKAKNNGREKSEIGKQNLKLIVFHFQNMSFPCKKISNDGVTFETSLIVAQMSETLAHLIEDSGTEEDIPLPNLNSNILRLVLLYCEKYQKENFKSLLESKNEQESEKAKKQLSNYNHQFCSSLENTSILTEVMLASNYLDIKPLLDVTCLTMAMAIKGKSPQEIKQILNVDNAFSAEEEEQIQKEYNWWKA